MPKIDKKPTTNKVKVTVDKPTMPEAAPETTKKQAPQPVNPRNKPVKYDKLVMNEYSTTSKHGPLTVLDAKTLMGWETEPEYKARMVSEKGGEAKDYSYGDDYHWLNTDLEKVRCLNNAGNRSFDSKWSGDLVHTILYGQWAGPFTVPGETVNCETVRISRYGDVISGQHQLTALIIADEWLQKSRAEPGNAAKPKYPAWNGQEHCFIETFVAFGMSAHPAILQTVDYNKPRSVADMLYTMELYAKNTPKERHELTRMLSTAIDLLWVRTETRGYKTHPEVTAFLERHKRLLKCVEHLFEENRVGEKVEERNGRRISDLHLSVGQCAALCYLMGSSGSDGDKYRNQTPPSEKKLDWSYWDKAREFWAKIGDKKDITFRPVRIGLNQLIESSMDDDDNRGLGGRAAEKLAIVAKAWDAWKEGMHDFTNSDLEPGGILSLSYSDIDDKGNKLPEGQIKLLDIADFSGIDCPQITTRRAKEPELEVSADEVEKAKEEARQRRAGG